MQNSEEDVEDQQMEETRKTDKMEINSFRNLIK